MGTGTQRGLFLFLVSSRQLKRLTYHGYRATRGYHIINYKSRGAKNERREEGVFVARSATKVVVVSSSSVAHTTNFSRVCRWL